MSLDIDLYVDYCDRCERGDSVYETNITHNFAQMALASGIYNAIWRPEDLGAKYAKDITEVVKAGYEKLVSDPEHFKKYNSQNGWGLYENFVPFVAEYLKALEEYPEAVIRVSR